MASLVVPGFKESDGIVFKTAPAGTYEGTVTHVELKPSGAGSKYPGKDILFITVKLDHDEFEANAKGMFMVPHEDMDTEEVQRNTDKLKRLWLACGLNPEVPETDDLMHCNIKVRVIEDEYNGTKSNKIVDTII